MGKNRLALDRVKSISVTRHIYSRQDRIDSRTRAQQIGPLPTVWLHSSVGRALYQHCTSIAPALHQHCRGHGFESRSIVIAHTLWASRGLGFPIGDAD